MGRHQHCRNRWLAIGGVLAVASALLPAAASATMRTVNASAAPTTAPFEAAGSEDPNGGSYGMVAPRRFGLVPIPDSWEFGTDDARWRRWGTATATATGTGYVTIIMTPHGYHARYALTLSRRRYIRCLNGRSHYSYEVMTLKFPDDNRLDFRLPIKLHAGCRQLKAVPVQTHA
jgi:hypothetical protein